ncbi:hypothetical protein C5167_022378 [Papaver somniferum]|uniref:Uncharacterized protein n=1 Tax=Papaver somniferum TaxID=3469 RepID=A0A4Y7JKS3_PAPSO|nr:hypothetical protein C5167_022378 [Papaver somniferum]
MFEVKIANPASSYESLKTMTRIEFRETTKKPFKYDALYELLKDIVPGYNLE